MPLRQGLTRLLLPLERVVDRRRTARRQGAVPVIDPYLGYATPDHVILRGRVLTALRRTEPDPRGHWFGNLRQMLSLFLTDEVAGVTVTAGDHSAVTDEEGYFQLPLPRPAQAAGWREEHVTPPGGAPQALEALVPEPGARFAVVSDIDDTVLHTGAHTLWSNLRTSLTGNALTREVYPDAVALLTALAAGGNPVFYVSSSPWNLHHFLQRIMARHGVPKGPMFLRDYGLGEAQFITGTHGDHKGSALDVLMGAMPDLSFVLVGDTGQHDPQVYGAAIERHPGRVALVILRQAGRADDPADTQAIEAIRAAGVPVRSVADYSGLPDDPELAGWLTP